MDAHGVDIKVVKAEFVDNYDEYSAPVNGKALRVYINFRNNNDDQVLMDNTDFSMKVNNEIMKNGMVVKICMKDLATN